MKLPDFYKFPELDDLRRRMGIPSDIYGSLEVAIDAGRLSEYELDRLTSPDGLDIASLDEVRILEDGTLAYKNSRVLLYIRDHSVYGSKRTIEPKFHVSNCTTLKEMARNNRAKRYVVATRLDGTFLLNLLIGTEQKQELRKLDVCQNCMDLLNYDGFQMGQSAKLRRQLVNSFTLDRFFEKYPQNLHAMTPEYDSDNAPLNGYSKDFTAKGNALKANVQWTCQNPTCRVRLEKAEYRRYLHVHHLNGIKSDDDVDNHQVLCIECHAKEPNHGHMKSMPDYRQYMNLKHAL